VRAVTRDKDFKRLVRSRASKTGERYTSARRALLREKGAVQMVRVMPEVPKIDVDERYPMIVLTEIDGDRVCSFSCGATEAAAIAWGLKGVETERPLTHDLLRDVVAAMGTAREVRVTEVRDKTFYAELVVVGKDGADQIVSCRPSDGVALALRADIPILVHESLMRDRATMDT
jgi:bifunctional DNase/RNase